MRTTLLPAIAVAALLATAAGASAQSMNTTMSPSAADRAFLRHASETNEAEIAEGRLAERQGGSTAVRYLGKRYADNHSANERKLEMLAEHLDVTLPMHPSAMQRMQMQQLAQLNGRAFDRAFLRDEQKGHEKAIHAFQTEITASSDPAIVAYAKATVPVLEEHLDLATEDFDRMHTAMNGTDDANGMTPR